MCPCREQVEVTVRVSVWEQVKDIVHVPVGNMWRSLYMCPCKAQEEVTVCLSL